MSDSLKHECGIGLVRLLKPLSYYHKKYGNALWGMNKIYLLMEKQHNRGQDGAGLASLKIDHPVGSPYLHRYRSVATSPLKDIYQQLLEPLVEIEKKHPDNVHNEAFLRQHFPFAGDVLMGHLRYGTHGENSINTCHPFERKNNWKTKNIMVSGNFNVTNVDEIIQNLINYGQHPKDSKDTVTIMENIGYYLDEVNDEMYHKYKSEGFTRIDISNKIAEEIDLLDVLKRAAKRWDGGYVIQGICGHGDAFVMRDPSGIRPAYYYADDEVIVVASERSAIATVFNFDLDLIKELMPAHALIIKKDGSFSANIFKTPLERKACSFERIYFSRGNDYAIYQERKNLGKLLVPQIMEAVNHDLKNTVFSYIPNTAETAFLGMIEGIEDKLNEQKTNSILELNKSNKATPEAISEILSYRVRIEKAAIKDIKLRTFITDDAHRGDMVAHIYDTTHNIIKKGIDTLVIIDDSIVRGTTLRDSILRILSRLKPKKIVIVSSAPQIRYPDCYGIDMSNLNTLIAFQAAVQLLRENNQESLIDHVYKLCKQDITKDKEDIINHVNKIFDSFSDEQISKRIAKMLYHSDFNCELEIVYQKIENLHKACPNNLGDWYFSGDFPTPGGNKVAISAFINYYEGNNKRAY